MAGLRRPEPNNIENKRIVTKEREEGSGWQGECQEGGKKESKK